MKLVYCVKFRAWGITFREIHGEVDLWDYVKPVTPALPVKLVQLVNERGVYIAFKLD
jgi:hypothetical protein